MSAKALSHSKLIDMSLEVGQGKYILSQNDLTNIKATVTTDSFEGGVEGLENVGKPQEDFDKIRDGREDHKTGRFVFGQEMSTDEFMKARYGFGKDTILKSFGVNTVKNSYKDMIEAFGYNMKNFESFSGFLLSNDITKNLRWIVQEVFRDQIDMGFKAAAINQNLIAGQINVPSRRFKVPKWHINNSDATPSPIKEGETIPSGRLNFGEKEVTLRKYGQSITLTDETLFESSIDMAGEYVAKVGREMALVEDQFFLSVAVNGEQADSSESAYIVGAQTQNSWTKQDFWLVNQKFTDLAYRPSAIVARDTTLVAIQNATLQDTRQMSPFGYGVTRDGVTYEFQTYSRAGVIGANDALIIDPRYAIKKANYRRFAIETDREASNGSSTVYISAYVGFYTLNRNARVLLRNSLAYSGNAYPTDMNAQAQVALYSF